VTVEKPKGPDLGEIKSIVEEGFWMFQEGDVPKCFMERLEELVRAVGEKREEGVTCIGSDEVGLSKYCANCPFWLGV